MSELMNGRIRENNFRRQLLSTVSSVVLLVAVSKANSSQAADQDKDRPTVWIELGGQMEHIGSQGEPFVPGFLAANPDSVVLQPTTPLQAQRPVPFSFGGEGKISIQPHDSNWVFSAGVNFGRSSNFKEVDHQTNGTHIIHTGGVPCTDCNGYSAANFADTQVHHQESHAILDFSVGKDVGLGIFGNDGSSILGFGVRFAQFVSKSTFDARARPDLHVRYTSKYLPGKGTQVRPFIYFNTYHATGSASRSFHGIGPSVSWSGSAPLVGDSQDGEVLFDWGANAAMLFGKQKARVQHQESANYISQGLFQLTHTVYRHPVTGHNTDRSVVIPNVGGFAGVSYRIENFKISAGYRADFFFGALDGGIDVRKSETLGFYGPFATISVGLGG